MANLGYQGWRSAENARLPEMWPGFDSGPVPYVAEAEFGFGSGLAVRVFLRVPRFSFLHRNQHSKFQCNKNIGSA